MREAQVLEGAIDRIVRYREPELLMQPHDQIARPPARNPWRVSRSEDWFKVADQDACEAFPQRDDLRRPYADTRADVRDASSGHLYVATNRTCAPSVNPPASYAGERSERARISRHPSSEQSVPGGGMD